MRGRIRTAPDAALAAALERGLPAPVRILARRDSPYASSFPLAELDVEAGDGTRTTVVWKDLTPEALLPGARAARAGDAKAGWMAADAELRAYELLDGAQLGTPRLVATAREPEHAWLFLEAVRGVRLEHVGDPAAWEAAARWLARAHAALIARAGDPAWPPPWEPADLTEAAARDPRVAALAPALDAARARLAAAPRRVIHGELYAPNVLIGETGRICVLDWETVARGPALLDLAALTAGAWEDPADPLAEVYRQALRDPPPREAFQADLDAARLLAAARWLDAPADWSPPAEQARDWLRDAELIAGRIPV